MKVVAPDDHAASGASGEWLGSGAVRGVEAVPDLAGPAPDELGGGVGLGSAPRVACTALTDEGEVVVGRHRVPPWGWAGLVLGRRADGRFGGGLLLGEDQDQAEQVFRLHDPAQDGDEAVPGIGIEVAPDEVRVVVGAYEVHVPGGGGGETVAAAAAAEVGAVTALGGVRVGFPCGVLGGRGGLRAVRHQFPSVVGGQCDRPDPFGTGAVTECPQAASSWRSWSSVSWSPSTPSPWTVQTMSGSLSISPVSARNRQLTL